MGETVEVNEYPMCDLCSVKFALYDGRTTIGPWANMCPMCWETFGCGKLGTGSGQRFTLRRETVVPKTKEEEVAFMRDPDEWPLWPVLPLKKTGGPLGALVESNVGVEPVVRLGNIYTDSHDIESYESLEAVYDAGWRVD